MGGGRGFGNSLCLIYSFERFASLDANINMLMN